MATPKKAQPIPWSHQETVHLIRAYQEKWYALKRGPLRHNQWEEVAVAVATRCGYDLGQPVKSALQCRHKMEKLRQRHRAHSKQPWPYDALMEELERGPLPISAFHSDHQVEVLPILKSNSKSILSEMRAFSKSFLQIENFKIHMIRETQRSMFHMENKRIQLILQSQRRIVDSIATAFASPSPSPSPSPSNKRIKITQPI
ncbi:hypothetical protein Fmac_028219 [Flemingia macrophylla]|uniref:Myb/SANT-like DNA-binding domain-containing protein n=1 Tax=Flemingia macrophylla TaxID=520843 RepID=A0ABD1L8B9_9FABA